VNSASPVSWDVRSFGFVTRMSANPIEPTGVLHVIEVEEIKTTLVAGTPSNETVAPFAKL